MNKKKVVFGFFGTVMDAGLSEKRWDRWRPTVALFGDEAFKIDRLELFACKDEQVTLAEKLTKDIALVQSDAEVHVHVLSVENPWNFQQVYAVLYDFAKAYTFEEDCDYYVHLTTGTHVAQICLFLLTEARYFPARIVQTSLNKAEREAENRWRGKLEVIDLDLSSYDQLAKRFQKESLDSQNLLKGGIATRNAAFNALIGRIERVALKSTAPMLLCGPTGAGKGHLAARVFELRARRHLINGPFVEVNCATLRGDNAMSALFGHKKGAYTGAAADRAGFLKSADGGILFLDEIGELGFDEQAMLLRALEDKRFTPMGSDKEIQSDFQLLAGTNRNLAKDVAAGRFRADLLARINVWQFALPGLAERREDIEPNLDVELERAGVDLGTRVSMTKEARDVFLAFAATAPWHGNFRDLASCATRMATLAEAGRIGVADVRLECENLASAWGDTDSVGPALSTPHAGLNDGEEKDRISQAMGADEAARLDAFDRVQLDAVLAVIAQTDSMAAAGRVLFAASRLAKDKPNDSDRLRKYLAKWKLDYSIVKILLARMTTA